MRMQSKVPPTHKTDRLMAMACLARQRPGRVRWLFSPSSTHDPRAGAGVGRRRVRARRGQRPGRDDRRDGHRRHGRPSPRRRRGGAGRGGYRAGHRHRRGRPVHVPRTGPGDVRRAVHPLRLHRARAGGGGARGRHGRPGRGNGGRGARRAGGGGRDPCPAAVGDRLAGPD